MTALHPAMKMTRAEKIERAEEKRRRVMHFLAGGEVYSTITILSRVMGVTVSNSAQYFPLISVQFFPLFRISETDFFDV